jgi:hypothetical protein
MRHTGGSALGEISTKSNSSSFAKARALRKLITAGSTFSPTRRTGSAVMFSLIR